MLSYIYLHIMLILIKNKTAKWNDVIIGNYDLIVPKKKKYLKIKKIVN